MNHLSDELESARIKSAVCRSFGIPIGKMDSQIRSEHISFPRQVAMWLHRELTSMSLHRVAEFFPGKCGKPKDHGTVYYACQMVKNRISTDDIMADKLIELKQSLRGQGEAPPNADTALLDLIEREQLLINCGPKVVVMSKDGGIWNGVTLREVLQRILETKINQPK